MKKLLCIVFATASCFASAQTYISIGTDTQGDDHNTDAKELLFRMNATDDTLQIKLEHYGTRQGDFGYALALDTNLTPGDGTPIPQHNLYSGAPNTSMNYDVMLYAYQNSFFPGVYTDAYVGNSPVTFNYTIDTTNKNYVVFNIPISELGGKKEVNIIGCVGSFDILPGGAGPSDVIPNTTFSEVRESGVGISELNRQMKIHPNPSNGYLNFEFPTHVETLEIRDLSGRVLRQYTPEANSLKIDNIDLPAGQYIAITRDGRESFSSKIVIQ